MIFDNISCQYYCYILLALKLLENPSLQVWKFPHFFYGFSKGIGTSKSAANKLTLQIHAVFSFLTPTTGVYNVTSITPVTSTFIEIIDRWNAD